MSAPDPRAPVYRCPIETCGACFYPSDRAGPEPFAERDVTVCPCCGRVLRFEGARFVPVGIGEVARMCSHDTETQAELFERLRASESRRREDAGR